MYAVQLPSKLTLTLVGAIILSLLESSVISQQIPHYKDNQDIHFETTNNKKGDGFHSRRVPNIESNHDARFGSSEEARVLTACFVGIETNCIVNQGRSSINCADFPTIEDAQDCIGELNYTYNITNTGGISEMINVVQSTRFGTTTDLSPSNINLNPGESYYLPEPVFEFNFCDEKRKDISTVVTVQASSTDTGQACQSIDLSKFEVSFKCGVEVLVKNCLYDSVGDGTFSASCRSIKKPKKSSDCDKTVKFLYRIHNIGPVTLIIFSLVSDLGGDILDSIPSSQRVLEPGESVDTEETLQVNICEGADRTVSNNISVVADTFPIDLGSTCNSTKTYPSRGKTTKSKSYKGSKSSKHILHSRSKASKSGTQSYQNSKKSRSYAVESSQMNNDPTAEPSVTTKRVNNPSFNSKYSDIMQTYGIEIPFPVRSAENVFQMDVYVETDTDLSHKMENLKTVLTDVAMAALYSNGGNKTLNSVRNLQIKDIYAIIVKDFIQDTEKSANEAKCGELVLYDTLCITYSVLVEYLFNHQTDYNQEDLAVVVLDILNGQSNKLQNRVDPELKGIQIYQPSKPKKGGQIRIIIIVLIAFAFVLFSFGSVIIVRAHIRRKGHKHIPSTNSRDCASDEWNDEMTLDSCHFPPFKAFVTLPAWGDKYE